MSGNKLLSERKRLEITQRQLAETVGVHTTQIRRLERSGKQALPLHWVEKIRPAIADFGARGTKEAQARTAILDELRRSPGIAQWRLLNVVGHGRPVGTALRGLIKANRVAYAVAWDDEGRKFQGLYRVNNVPKRGQPDFGPDELRRIRKTAGWGRVALADALGVAVHTVGRWETGARSCSPDKAREVRKILAGLPPVG
jgi:transcriptional regulator with XRE-family HTH domain